MAPSDESSQNELNAFYASQAARFPWLDDAPQVPRYIPPYAREAGGMISEAPIRPESSASQRTFASQIPLSDAAHGLPPPRGQPFGTNYVHSNLPMSNGISRVREGDIYGAAYPGGPLVNLGPGVNSGSRFSRDADMNGGNGHRAAHPRPLGERSNGTPGHGYGVIGDRRQPSHANNAQYPAAPSGTDARSLAAYIMSGALDVGEANFGAPTPLADSSQFRRSTVNGGRSGAPAYSRASHSYSRSRNYSISAQGPSQQIVRANHAPSPAPAHNVDPVLGTARPPTWFDNAINGRMPTLDQAFSDMPFVQLFNDGMGPSTAGVIKIMNIPYDTARNEVIAHVGRTARLVQQPPGSPYYGVHIIVERMTGKTMDCFVEVVHRGEAAHIVDHFQRRVASGRHPKIGDRYVDLEVSSQEELMHTLFPRARNVEWNGVKPIISATTEEFSPGVRAAGFQGFLQHEEINMIVKYSEVPQRSPFIQRCPHRTYETLISTLHKYPWFAAEYVSLAERKLLFEATNACIKTLMNAVRGAEKSITLTPVLLQELATTAMSCPGFSEKQKSVFSTTLRSKDFDAIASGVNVNVPFGGNHAYSEAWPFLALSKSHSARDDVVEYYVSLVRAASTKSPVPNLADVLRQPFGDLLIDYGIPDLGRLTLATAAKKELNMMRALLAAVLPRSLPLPW